MSNGRGGIDFSDSAAITATVVSVVTAVIGLIVAAGLPLSKDLTDHIVILITVVTPVVIGVIGLLHRNSAKVQAARVLADSGTTNSVHV